MTNSEYYGILGLIRKEQGVATYLGMLILTLLIVLVLFPVGALFTEVVIYDDTAVEKVLIVILVGGLITILAAGWALRATVGSEPDLVKLLNECRHLSAEEVEKKEEFKKLFQ